MLVTLRVEGLRVKMFFIGDLFFLLKATIFCIKDFDITLNSP